ncbi:MAG: NAD(P)H-dependent oxidoreductase [Eubacteriales bacterium]|nr:NAD(P)H-dependent oxidoreductase [Eubacteriales bacterium]
MKITIINGQNHKECSWNMGQELVKALGEDNEITEFFLPRDMPHFCIGCANCIYISEEKCPHYVSMKPIEDAVSGAELLIFTTPTYVYHASGSMKALLDHFAWRWIVHRPDGTSFSKQAVAVASSAGSTTKHTLNDIADSFKFWGIGRIYRFGMAVLASKWVEISPKKREKIEKKRKSSRIKSKSVTVNPTLPVFRNFSFS